MNIRALCNQFSARCRKRSRPQRRRRRFSFESLERRELLAGDLAITSVQLATNEGDPVDQVFTGEQVFLRADWTSDWLAQGDGYLVRFAVDGEELDSHGLIYSGSGVIVLRSSDGTVSQGGPTDTGRYWLRGAWFASPGMHAVTVTIDGTNRVDYAQGAVHVHDLQATMLHLLGIDHERLHFRFQGRRFRLTDVHGHVVKEVLA